MCSAEVLGITVEPLILALHKYSSKIVKYVAHFEDKVEIYVSLCPKYQMGDTKSL
jgi:hypothetical protein